MTFEFEPKDSQIKYNNKDYNERLSYNEQLILNKLLLFLEL